ncbi:hypothetical protein DFP72DRAFT_817410, partial [Ephemerocybe angulata]
LQRKNGLFKKVYELGVLCSVDVAVIIFEERAGHHAKLYEYCSTDIRDMVSRHMRVRALSVFLRWDEALMTIFSLPLPLPPSALACFTFAMNDNHDNDALDSNDDATATMDCGHDDDDNGISTPTMPITTTARTLRSMPITTAAHRVRPTYPSSLPAHLPAPPTAQRRERPKGPSDFSGGGPPSGPQRRARGQRRRRGLWRRRCGGGRRGV